jgi:hypothetical protein
MRVVLPALLALSAFTWLSADAQISITSQTSYHKASFGSTYGTLESGTADNGGLITLFVKNNGSIADSLIEVTVSAGGVTDTLGYAVWWPLEMAPGGTSSVLLKGIASPFGEGETVVIEATTALGYAAQQTFVNTTPKLRIANLMPSRELNALWIYLRNDGNVDAVFNGMEMNDTELLPGNPALQIFGNSTTLKPGAVAILKIQTLPGVLYPLVPIRLNIRFTSENTQQNVSTFQRLVPAEFPIGTWHSPLANNSEEEGRKRLRRLAITSVFGPNDVSDMTDNLPEYCLKVVREADFSVNGAFAPQNAAQYVSQNSNNPVFHYWNVDDEPDLNNKPIAEEIIKNKTYWLNDANTPSYVNLASQKNFQRYGFFTDVVSMDHYSDDGPPNVIPFPYWYTTEGSVREAIEYTEQLKKNTEPKRMNSWSQLISNAFSNQAEPFVINFQFWAHVSAGAKGIHLFTAKPNHLDDNPSLWNESVKLARQLNGIKNLCLYGEPWNGVTVNSGNVIAKSMAGPDAMVVTVLNNTIDYTLVNVINHNWSASISSAPFDIQFTVPEWIPLEKFYETDANGRFDISSITQVSGRTYRITGTMGQDSKVFVIGKNDTEPPQPITEINVSEEVTPSDFTLSWNEPSDNFGVKGYYIKAGSQIIDSVQAPIWESNNTTNGCSVAEWSIIPYDDARNLGQPVVITNDWSGFGSGTPMVSSQPGSQNVFINTTASFSIADTGATSAVYQWQSEAGNGTWFNLENGNGFSGVYTPTLSVVAAVSLNNSRYRCIVSAGCTQNRDTSNAALLTVIDNSFIEEAEEADIRVFPNPSDELFILRNNTGENYRVSVTDQLGRLVKQGILLPASSDVYLDGLTPGIYQVVLQSSEEKRITKTIVAY